MDEKEISTLDTITLNKFDWLTTKIGAIQLSLFDDEVYSATLILWVNKEEFPLFLETSICCVNEECAILQAYDMLNNLCDKVYTVINVFDENGDELEDMDLNDYLED